MMSRALSEIARNNALIPWMTCTALVLFFAFFAGMLIWTARPASRRLYSELRKLPLESINPESQE